MALDLGGIAKGYAADGAGPPFEGKKQDKKCSDRSWR